MTAIQIQAWKPKRAKRRVPLPIVAIVNLTLVAIGLASTAFIYHRFTQLAAEPRTVATVEAPVVRPIAPVVRPAAPAVVAETPKPKPEPIDISKPQRREPRQVAPLLEAKPPESIAATVIVDVSSGRQVFDLPGEGGLFRIARIEGFPGRPILSPFDGDLSQAVDVQPLTDRTVYLELSTKAGKMMIETKSALPQFSGRLSIDRVAKIRDETTKRFEVASARKAVILGEIEAIESFLKDGRPKKLTVYNRGESQKTILKTNLEVVEIALNQARAEMTQANRVYSAITEHLPRMRLIIVRNSTGD